MKMLCERKVGIGKAPNTENKYAMEKLYPQSYIGVPYYFEANVLVTQTVIPIHLLVHKKEDNI